MFYKKHYLIVQKQQAALISNKHLFFFPLQLLFDPVCLQSGSLCVRTCVCVRAQGSSELLNICQQLHKRSVIASLTPSLTLKKKKDSNKLLQDLKLCSYFVSSDSIHWEILSSESFIRAQISILSFRNLNKAVTGLVQLSVRPQPLQSLDAVLNLCKFFL